MSDIDLMITTKDQNAVRVARNILFDNGIRKGVEVSATNTKNGILCTVHAQATRENYLAISEAIMAYNSDHIGSPSKLTLG